MRKYFIFLVLVLCLPIDAGAQASVQKIILVPRQPGVLTFPPQMALNTKTNQTLVVWEREFLDSSRRSLWGKLLQSDGIPTGSEFLIINGPKSQGHEITYNPVTNQFVLAYSNAIVGNRFELFAVKLNSSGRRSGQPVRISSPADRQRDVINFGAKIIYDSKSGNYDLFWRRYGISSAVAEEGLYGTVLNVNLKFVRTPVLLQPLVRLNTFVRGPIMTDLKFHPISGELLIAGYTWGDSTQGTSTFDYFVSPVDLSLDQPLPNLIRVQNRPSDRSQPDIQLMFLSNGETSVVYVEGLGMKRRKLNQQFRPTGSVNFFFNSPIRNSALEYPRVSSQTTQLFVIGIQASNNTNGIIWLQPCNNTGTATGAPIEVASDFDAAMYPVLSKLPGAGYALVYIEGTQTFPPMPDTSSGLILLKLIVSF